MDHHVRGFPLDLIAEAGPQFEQMSFPTLDQAQNFLIDVLGFSDDIVLEEEGDTVVAFNPTLIQVSERIDDSASIHITNNFCQYFPNVELKGKIFSKPFKKQNINDLLRYVATQIPSYTFCYDTQDVYLLGSKVIAVFIKNNGKYFFHPSFINRVRSMNGDGGVNAFTDYDEERVNKWDEVREKLDSSHKKMAECLKPLLKPGDCVLDVGSGTGGIEEHFQDDDAGARFWCMDGNTAMLNRLKSRNFAYVQGTALCVLGPTLTLPFHNGSFNHVVCNGVIPYLSDATFRRLAHEMYRVLMPGGRAYLSFQAVPTNQSDNSVKKYHLKKGPVIPNMGSTFVFNSQSFFYDTTHVTRVLENSGFTSIPAHSGNFSKHIVHSAPIYIPEMQLWTTTKNNIVLPIHGVDILAELGCEYTYVCAYKP